MRRLLCLSLLFSFACRGQPSQILLVIDAEPRVRRDAQAIRVNIFGGNRDEPVPNRQVHQVTQPMTSADWPRRYALAPDNADAERIYRFEAYGLPSRADSPEDLVPPTAFVSARIISGYVRGETLEVHLVLYDACVDVDCTNPEETCDPRTRLCVPAFRDPDQLPHAREGGVGDAGVNGRPCLLDADCDDGAECTEEHCVDDVCQYFFHDERCPAHPCAEMRCSVEGCMPDPATENDALCDDNVGCTTDSCDVTADPPCVIDADDALCDPGQTCDAENGCQSERCTPENCVAENDCTGAVCNAEGTLCMRPPRCDGGPGSCCPGEATCGACNDGNPCTDDRCSDDESGCDFVFDATNDCDDNNPCTLNDFCVDGATPRCMGDSPPPCDFNSTDCWRGSCVPTSATTYSCSNEALSGTACGEGACTGTCSVGACNSSCVMDGGSPECSGPGECTSGGACSIPSCNGGRCEYNWACSDDELCCGTCCPAARCCAGSCCPSGTICTGFSCTTVIGDGGLPLDGGPPPSDGGTDAGMDGGRFDGGRGCVPPSTPCGGIGRCCTAGETCCGTICCPGTCDGPGICSVDEG
jgi:hypothetical protein